MLYELDALEPLAQRSKRARIEHQPLTDRGYRRPVVFPQDNEHQELRMGETRRREFVSISLGDSPCLRVQRKTQRFF